MKKLLCQLGLLMSVTATSMALETPLGLPYAQDIKEIVRHGELRVAIYVDSALSSFVAVDKDGQMSGYNVDMAQAIASQLGVKLHIDQATSYNDAVALVAKQKDDLAISNVTATPARALSVSFTQPYYSMPQTLIVQKNFDVSKLDIDKEVVSTAPLRIGVEANSAYPQFVKLAFPNATLFFYSSFDEGIKDISANKYDAIFVDGFPAEQGIVSAASLALVKLGEVHVDPVSIVVSSDQPELVAWLNLYLNSLDGKVTEMALKKKNALL